MPKISVIVPVYNAEQYLHKCLDSILRQTFGDIEVLLINDGSTDNSARICDFYAARDSRVRVFHKLNGGVSSARNLGLEKAVGEWIAYVDSDDWIAPNMYEELYNNALEQGSDIVYSDFMMNYGSKVQYYASATYSSDKSEFMKNYISSVWTCLVIMLVKREVYERNNLRSPIHLSYCEDFWLSVRLLHYAQKISYVNRAYYNYNRINEASRVNNLDERTEHDEIVAYQETIEFFEKEGQLDDYEQVLSWRILKSKQEFVLDESRHDEFREIYPVSHKYIWRCPYLNKKIKIMMLLLTYGMRNSLNLIIWTRKLLKRK